MSAGIGIKGRDVVMTIGGSTCLGVNNKGIAFSNEMGETTDDQSAGWTEFLAEPLKRQAELTISGIAKNMELVSSFFGNSHIFAVTKPSPDGSVLSGDFAMTGAPSFTGESNALVTFDASFTSSGALTWTPAA